MEGILLNYTEEKLNKNKKEHDIGKMQNAREQVWEKLGEGVKGEYGKDTLCEILK